KLFNEMKACDDTDQRLAEEYLCEIVNLIYTQTAASNVVGLDGSSTGQENMTTTRSNTSKCNPSLRPTDKLRMLFARYSSNWIKVYIEEDCFKTILREHCDFMEDVILAGSPCSRTAVWGGF